MKFLLLSLALLGAVAADVSHLNNMYLPPHMSHLGQHQHHHHVEYAQQSQEIPEVSHVEITDNGINAPVESQQSIGEQQFFTGKIDAGSLNYELGYNGGIQAQTDSVYTDGIQAQTESVYTGGIQDHTESVYSGDVQSPIEEKKYFNGFVYQSVHDEIPSVVTTTTRFNTESSVPAPGLDTFSQQQTDSYYTQNTQEQEIEKQYYTGLVVPSEHESVAAISTSTSSQVEQVAEEPEQKYYTGLITPESAAASTGSISSTTTINAETSVPAPVSDIYTQPQSVVYTQTQETDNKYYTGLNIPSEEQQHLAVTTSDVPHVEEVAQEPEIQYQTSLIGPTVKPAAPAPGSDAFTQQQATLNTQESQNQEVENTYHSGVVSSHTNEQEVVVSAPVSDNLSQQQGEFFGSVSHHHEAAAAAPALSVRSGISSGIDTKYAENGGYIY